jgi:tetratricopeptide (TPR) repeat protein
VPTASIIQFVVDIEDIEFEDIIEELILCSLIIPEQFQSANKEIVTKYTLLPLTKGYTRIQLNKNVEIREALNNRINQVENTISTTEKAKKEYRHSLYNYGAKTDEEKIATIIAQTAFQKYQTGQYDAAVEEYKRAIKIAPSFAAIYRNWAIMESYENHLIEAEQLMIKAASLDSNDPQIFLIWGNIYRKSSKHTEAQKKYALAYALAPYDPIILNAYGQSKSRLGEFEEADNLLQKAIQPNSEFSSLKHEIINRTSLAENYINWGDYYARDRNFGEAERKYKNAIEECQKIISSNSKDILVYNTLSRASLKCGQLYIKEGNEEGAIEYLSQIIKFPTQSFKQGLYKLTAIAELGNYYKNKNNYSGLKKLMELYSHEFKNSQILRRFEYRELNDKLNKLKDYIEHNEFSVGSIKTVNIDRGFVIIEEKSTGITFFGHVNSFKPKITELSLRLRGIEVLFQPSTEPNSDKEKNEAINIKITDDNNRLLPNAPKRRT